MTSDFENVLTMSEKLLSANDTFFLRPKIEIYPFSPQMKRLKSEFELLFVLDVLSCQSNAVNEHLLRIFQQ